MQSGLWTVTVSVSETVSPLPLFPQSSWDSAPTGDFWWSANNCHVLSPEWIPANHAAEYLEDWWLLGRTKPAAGGGRCRRKRRRGAERGYPTRRQLHRSHLYFLMCLSLCPCLCLCLWLCLRLLCRCLVWCLCLCLCLCLRLCLCRC